MSNGIKTVNARKKVEWPSGYDYSYNEITKILEISLNTHTKKLLKGIDVWALALSTYLEKCNDIVQEIRIVLHFTKHTPEVESLLRRVSFLVINNRLNISIWLNGNRINLYPISALLKQKSNELLRSDVSDRDSKDKSTGLEKLLQNYLFDTGDKRTNERLAIFGEDFIGIKKKKLGSIREFPTGVFNLNISKNDRILPTEFVDFVTINKYGQLALIELKINDTQLEVISQALNYFLFFARYYGKLKPLLEARLNVKLKKRIFKGYVVNNKLHPKFEDVKKYYRVKDTRMFPFEIVPTILGYYIK
jgi:hypothetical protein